MSQLFASGGQSIGVSASAAVLAMSIQGCFPLGLTGLVSLQSNELSRVFSMESHFLLCFPTLYKHTAVFLHMSMPAHTIDVW